MLRELLGWSWLMQGVLGISLCSSTVFVGSDQRKEQFHTESLSTLDTDLKYFCSSHEIYEDQCETIRNYHINRCFGEETIMPVESVKDSNDAVINDNDDEKSDQHEAEEDKDMLSKSVDFSQSYGPTLSVSLENKAHLLKMYVGETPHMALKRFCGMIKLDTPQCKQVKLAYYDKCRENDIFDEVLREEILGGGESSSNEGQVNSNSHHPENPKSDDTFEFRTDSKTSDKVNIPAVKWILSVCEQYWNIIALIIVILYVATEQIP